MAQNRMSREEFFAKLTPKRRRRKHDAAIPPDPALVLAEISQFVELARSGAYIAGDRRVSRTERTKWRVTFRQLATDAQLALHAEVTAPGERAMELMIDLARHVEGSFRSEDPLRTAGATAPSRQGCRAGDRAGSRARADADHAGYVDRVR